MLKRWWEQQWWDLKNDKNSFLSFLSLMQGASIKYVRTEGEGGGGVPKAYIVREVA